MRAAPSFLLLSLLAASCLSRQADEEDFDVEVRPDTGAPLVSHLVWTTEEAGTSWVEWTDEGGEHATPVAGPSTEHDHPLYGLYPLSEVHYTAYFELEDGSLLESSGSFQTENVPSDFPSFDVTIHDEGAMAPTPFFLVVVEGEVPLLGVIDREGTWRWAYRLGQNDDQEDPMRVINSHVLFLEDGRLLYNTYEFSIDGQPNGLSIVDLDGRAGETYSLPMHHHAFCMRDADTVGYIAMDVRDFYVPSEGEEVPVAGDAIEELDLATGETRTIFTTWDWQPPSELAQFELIPGVKSWTHANSLYYYPELNAYLFSLGFLDTVLEIDADSGEVLRSFGRYGDYGFSERREAFSFQHDVQWTEEGHLLMMTLGPDQEEDIAAEYVLEPAEYRLEKVWSYGEGLERTAATDTEAHRLPNGNTLVSWTLQGHVDEATPDGEVVWELQSSLGAVLMRILPFDDFYAPQIY